MIPPHFRLVLLCAALVACGDTAPKTVKLSQAMPQLLLPPEPTFVSRSSGPDALQITVRSPRRADTVAAYYRALFKQGGWRLVNEAKDRDGATVLFAEQKGPALWVRIQPADDGNGTLVQLSGAVVGQLDSTAAAKPKS